MSEIRMQPFLQKIIKIYLVWKAQKKVIWVGVSTFLELRCLFSKFGNIHSFIYFYSLLFLLVCITFLLTHFHAHIHQWLPCFTSLYYVHSTFMLLSTKQSVHAVWHRDFWNYPFWHKCKQMPSVFDVW